MIPELLAGRLALGAFASWGSSDGQVFQHVEGTAGAT